MNKALIIKTGAAGDVVRTTVLLNLSQVEFTWAIDPKHRPLLPDHPRLKEIINIDKAQQELAGKYFDLVISLEEDPACASLVSIVRSPSIIGLCIRDGKLIYTPSSAGWFDMSLASAKGKELANELKKNNQFPYQHLLFEMLDRHFNNEPYVIFKPAYPKKTKGLVGIEKRVGRAWPNKAWAGYDDLIALIAADGYTVKLFEQRENLRDYMEDIAACSCIISGDSLPMHLAMAYQIPCLAIFNCTSPTEIYDYGVLKKIVSPLLGKYFYSKEHIPEVINSISVEEVYQQFSKLQLPK